MPGAVSSYVLAFAANALANALTGVLSQRFGPAPTVLLLLVPYLGLAALTTWYPALRGSGA